MLIRDESRNDIPAINALLASAFSTAPNSRQTEHLIVNQLRHSGQLRLSLVAMEGDSLSGYIAFSPVRIDGVHDGWFGLGPVAVSANRQGLGIGSELIQAGMNRLRTEKAKGCVVMGDPVYYGRFGFRYFPELVADGIPDGYFMARPLDTDCTRLCLYGRVAYDRAFATCAPLFPRHPGTSPATQDA